MTRTRQPRQDRSLPAVASSASGDGGLGEVESRLEAALHRLVARKDIHHAVVGVEQGDGSLRWIGAAGQARPGGEPMRPDTPYFIASVTKLYIAAAVLGLWEEGAVGLDDPFTDYLPESVGRGLHRLGGVDHTGAVTVRHLLSHTSGLPDFLEDRPKGGRSLLEQVLADGDATWDLDEITRRTREDLTPHFAPRDLSAPRVRARYSDTSFQLLIAIIEAVTGDPLHEVFAARFFRPLDMRHTYLPGQSTPLDPTPEASAQFHGAEVADRPQAVAACRDIVSTAGDQLTFLGALMRGDVFADPATVEVMQERWNPLFYPMQYGIGMMRFPVNRLVAPGSRPVTLIGHSGASGSWAFACPELDVRLVGTVDQWTARRVPFRFMSRLLRALAA